MKRLNYGPAILLLILALILAGCGTSSPTPSNPSNPADPTTPTEPADPGASGFTLSFNPATLSLAPGGNAQATLTITRGSAFTGEVALTLTGSVVGTAADPTKVSGSLTPNPADGDSSTLSLVVGSEVAVGTYDLVVTGSSGTLSQSATLRLSVTGAQTVLLVDDDRSANNYDPANPNITPSASDTIFQEVLTALGVGYNIYVVPGDASGPSAEQLQNYETVVWYTASAYGSEGNIGTISSADEVSLKAFLDQGERQALLFANSYIDGIDSSWDTTTNTFLTDYIGAIGGVADVLNNQAFVASGVAGEVTEGTAVNVAANTPITTYTDVVNPASSTDSLMTVPADPDSTGTRDVTVVSGNPDAGTAGTSSVVYIGLAYENIVDVGSNSKLTLMQTLLGY